jgi:hypothetical protein
MFKYTANTLKKIETIFEESGYTIRYEKGNFQSGYCILQEKKVVVISKYYLTEARINCLLDIISQVELVPSKLSEASSEFYAELLKNKTASN